MNQFENTEKNSSTTTKNGYVLAITGTVVDVQFPNESTPNILNELHILFPHHNDGEPHKKASIEVAQQLGDGAVRCIAIENIYNITRGLEVVDTGAPITVPVGNQVLGRVFNVLGNPIDGKPAIVTEDRWPIFKTAPSFVDLKVKNEIQETGIKVIDIMCPYIKGSKIGLFGGAGVGKTVLVQELIRNIATGFCVHGYW